VAGDLTMLGFAERVGRTADALSGGRLKEITGRVALAAKGDVLDQVGNDVGSDRRMSGWGRVRFNAGYELTSDHTAELEPRPSGPWGVLEHGRKAKPAGQPKRKTHKVYRTPAGLRTASRERPFRQGSTRGHRTWSVAVRKIDAETPKRVDDEMGRVLAEVWS